MSFLSAIAKVPVAVFKWIASPKGQNVIKTGEALAVSIDPALSGIIGLANMWMEKAITTETIAAAAGAQEGTGEQKAVAVIAAMEPEALKYFPQANADQIAKANKAIVDFLNAFESPSTAPVSPAPTA